MGLEAWDVDLDDLVEVLRFGVGAVAHFALLSASASAASVGDDGDGDDCDDDDDVGRFLSDEFEAILTDFIANLVDWVF